MPLSTSLQILNRTLIVSNCKKIEPMLPSNVGGKSLPVCFATSSPFSLGMVEISIGSPNIEECSLSILLHTISYSKPERQDAIIIVFLFKNC